MNTRKSAAADLAADRAVWDAMEPEGHRYVSRKHGSEGAWWRSNDSAYRSYRDEGIADAALKACQEAEDEFP